MMPFLDQRMDDAMHGRTGEAGRPHHLGQRHAVFAACGKNTQHRERAPDRLRALSRFRHAEVVLSIIWTRTPQFTRQVKRAFGDCAPIEMP
ncbi:hypothetical protein ACVWW3_006093 [Bradyrhizobium sp. LM2.9]